MALSDVERTRLQEHLQRLPFKMNKALAEALWAMRLRVMKGDRKRDAIIVVDGAEGSGKTVLASQIAFFLQPERFALGSHVAWYPDQFLSQFGQGRAFDPHLYDEGVTGFFDRTQFKGESVRLQLHLNTCRSKQRFVVVVQPRFYEMYKTLALERSRALIHVYEYREGKESRFNFYNQRAKESLYYAIKRARSGMHKWGWSGGGFTEDLYLKHATVPVGWFPNYWIFPEDEYERCKQASLDEYAKLLGGKSEKTTKRERWLSGLSAMALKMLHEEFGLSRRAIAREFKSRGFEVTDVTIGRILGPFEGDDATLQAASAAPSFGHGDSKVVTSGYQ